MQGFFKQIWQWLKRFLGQFTGENRGLSSSSRQKFGQPQEVVALTDTDYEFLFSQLLEGIAHGWHEGRVLKFFEQLKERGKTRPWVSWLERFGEKVLASSSPNLVLATRMMRLGELAQAFPKIEPIGHQAYIIGRQLYAREAANNEIWEYSGPDIEPVNLTSMDTDEAGQPAGQMETYTLNELTTQLQTDPVLAEHLANEFGLESPDPNAIIAALMEKFNLVQEELNNQPLPETAEGWFQRGLQQANIGDLEAAIASWDQALALDPDFIPAWQSRGSALGNLGRLDEAITCFERVLILNPEDHQAWFNRGLVYEAMNNSDEAIASYQKTLELDPSMEIAQERIHGLQA
ncbi:MAG: tetratricopeptide repeat protein [Snowella sp.]|nr:tetratricopeptide repeat protein [Snowella sp.]